MILLRPRRTLTAALSVLLAASSSSSSSPVFASSVEKPLSSPSSTSSSSSRRRNDPTCVDGSDASPDPPPYVPPRTFTNGVVRDALPDDASIDSSEVEGCCVVVDDASSSSAAPTERRTEGDPPLRPAVVGSVPQMSAARSLQILSDARKAWDGGRGRWPQTSLRRRIHAVETFLIEMRKVREEVVATLMWEIGKNRGDAESEFDRTVKFVEQTIAEIRNPTNVDYNDDWTNIGSSGKAFVRRSAIGIILCLGPYNYPLNETYATLIPALLMGNVVVMKIPTVGGLAHLLMMDAFAKSFPPGSINLISGSGRETMPPLMETGLIDGLAFVGGSRAADDLIKNHPEPHRLKLFLQLEAKNMAIFLPELFEPSNRDALDRAMNEAVSGSLSYNGQRCTALKIVFVPSSEARSFGTEFAKRVEGLSVGLPWQRWSDDDGKDGDAQAKAAGSHYSKITPLPNVKIVRRMKRLIDDATSKGAKILNERGGTIIGGPTSTLMVPAVLYPITGGMDLYDEEQFGPVVPIVPYDDLNEVLTYGREGKYGQQCSVFAAPFPSSSSTTSSSSAVARILDEFSSVFGKINVNSQCGRSPDDLPFSGRRSSALGVMSVSDAPKEFSVPTVVAYKDRKGDDDDDDEATTTVDVLDELRRNSKFLERL